MSYTNEQMQEYREKRRQKARNILGGKCVRCSKTDDLEFDHIEPSSKLNTIASLITSSWPIFFNELKKCQLLCKICHQEKSAQECMNRHPLVHGKISNYKNKKCVCDICRNSYLSHRRKMRRKGLWK